MQNKLREMLAQFTFRQDVIKKVFDNDNGRLVLEWLKLYTDAIEDIDNPNRTYFNAGKRALVREIESITDSKIKPKKETK